VVRANQNNSLESAGLELVESRPGHVPAEKMAGMGRNQPEDLAQFCLGRRLAQILLDVCL
jgi:hypothetical protein